MVSGAGDLVAHPVIPSNASPRQAIVTTSVLFMTASSSPDASYEIYMESLFLDQVKLIAKRMPSRGNS
jgi:hypothetical protein